jgi:NAD(P)-dependent dehydrogenase (short-subunit alcohol dehydrogenase family)
MSKTWLITGAWSWLGRLMTERLLARGDRIVATARRESSLADLQREHGDRLVVPVLDLTDTAGVRAVLASAFRQLCRIDVLVSNAGYGLFGAAEEVAGAQIDHEIATNLVGSIQFIRAAIPHLREQGGGRIVQVSSEGGQMAYPNFSLYHATKWGIEGFIESVARGRALRNRLRYRRTRAHLYQFQRRSGTHRADGNLSGYARWCGAAGYCPGKLCSKG